MKQNSIKINVYITLLCLLSFEKSPYLSINEACKNITKTMTLVAIAKKDTNTKEIKQTTFHAAQTKFPFQHPNSKLYSKYFGRFFGLRKPIRKLYLLC